MAFSTGVVVCSLTPLQCPTPVCSWARVLPGRSGNTALYDGVMSEPIDLHTHSTASDGSDSPGEVIAAAAKAGIHTVALTDHDTVSGWAEATEAATALDVGLIPGIELSTQVFDENNGFEPHSVHLLGYLIDPTHPQLVEEMAKIRSHRDNRLQMMVEKLAKDFPISWLEVRAGIPDGATPGRPHIAEVLIAKGIVKDTTEAFQHILAGDGPYHVPHYAPTLETGIRIIREAGGVPVLAHPLSRGGTPLTDVRGPVEEAVTRYQRWWELGLMGVELHHRENVPEQRPALEEVAGKLGLIITGSSDYHGSKKPNPLGEHTTTPEALREILERSTGVRPIGAMPAGV